MLSQTARIDLLVVADMVAPKSRVLDVGCGDGTLLRLLAEERGVDARGIEISQSGVNDCVAKGLSVIQGDADTDLADYPDDAFRLRGAVANLAGNAPSPPRSRKHAAHRPVTAIVSFSEFGHWRNSQPDRLKGRMPVTKSLSAAWLDTPNIHFCTIRDFIGLVDEIGAKTERSIALDQQGRPAARRTVVGLEPDWRSGGSSSYRGRSSISSLRSIRASLPSWPGVLPNALCRGHPNTKLNQNSAWMRGSSPRMTTVLAASSSPPWRAPAPRQ